MSVFNLHVWILLKTQCNKGKLFTYFFLFHCFLHQKCNLRLAMHRDQVCRYMYVEVYMSNRILVDWQLKLEKRVVKKVNGSENVSIKVSFSFRHQKRFLKMFKLPVRTHEKKSWEYIWAWKKVPFSKDAFKQFKSTLVWHFD